MTIIPLCAIKIIKNGNKISKIMKFFIIASWTFLYNPVKISHVFVHRIIKKNDN